MENLLGERDRILNVLKEKKTEAILVFLVEILLKASHDDAYSVEVEILKFIHKILSVQ